MLDLLYAVVDPESLKSFLSEAASAEFTRTCTYFALAAFIHSRQVRKEIKAQFGELVSVLREDLDAQKSVLAGLAGRVDKIEAQLHSTKEK